MNKISLWYAFKELDHRVKKIVKSEFLFICISIMLVKRSWHLENLKITYALLMFASLQGRGRPLPSQTLHGLTIHGSLTGYTCPDWDYQGYKSLNWDTEKLYFSVLSSEPLIYIYIHPLDVNCKMQHFHYLLYTTRAINSSTILNRSKVEGRATWKESKRGLFFKDIYCIWGQMPNTEQPYSKCLES